MYTEICSHCQNTVTGKFSPSTVRKTLTTIAKKGGMKAVLAYVGSVFPGLGTIGGFAIGTAIDLIWGNNIDNFINKIADEIDDNKIYVFTCPKCGHVWSRKEEQLTPSTSEQFLELLKAAPVGILEDEDKEDDFLDDYDYINDKVIDIVSHTLNVKKSAIHTYTKLADLGADSLDAVDIIMEIEKEFDIIVSEESTSKINTVGDIITNIAKSQIIDEEDDNEDGYDEDEYDEEYDDDYESDDFLNDYDSIKNKVFEIVSDTLSVEKEVIHTYTKLSDLGADSLDADLITEIENIFDIIVPDGSTSKINTVGDIITYITKHQYQ